MIPVPFLLAPIPVPRVWGGTRLLTDIHPELDPPLDPSGELLPVGETWEVSDVDIDPALHSRVISGAHAGRSLRAVFREDPMGILGKAGIAIGSDGAPELPLLFKYIDACETLSVQVHPSDGLLRRLGRPGRGKSESWVILDAAPGARIYVGFEEGWDLARYVAAARTGDGVEGLQIVPVERGNVVEIPAGLVHAIGGGILLAEIQQSSDITWRIHDWGRVGLDNKPRPLHLLEAAQAIPPDPTPPCPLPEIPIGDRWTRAIDGRYFRLDIWWGPGIEIPIIRRGDRFGILALLEGAGARLEGGEGLSVSPGGVIFVPAGTREDLKITADGPVWALWIEPGDPPGD